MYEITLFRSEYYESRNMQLSISLQSIVTNHSAGKSNLIAMITLIDTNPYIFEISIVHILCRLC